MSASLDEILSNFELLEDWEERYRYLIELGRMMPPLPEEARVDRNKVMGCASQVWLESLVERPYGEAVLPLRLSLRPSARSVFAEHLTPQR